MIKINALEKRFNKGKSNEVRALRGINAEFGDTGLYVIYGKSGSGKSTLMDMIGGLNSFDHGYIEIDGKRYDSIVDDEYRIENIGYIFQNYCLDAKYNVYDNVALGLRTVGITDEEEIFTRVMTALASVGLEDHYKRDVLTLSGGEQQRVAIARAMAKGSSVILADEPTGNLDEENTRLVLDILRELAKTRLVILVTHEEDIASGYADSVIEIRDGVVDSVTCRSVDKEGDDSAISDMPLERLACIKAGEDRAVFRARDVFRESFVANFGIHAKARNKVLNVAIILMVLSLILVATLLGNAVHDFNELPHDLIEVNATIDSYGNGAYAVDVDDHGFSEYLETNKDIKSYYFDSMGSLNINISNFDTVLINNFINNNCEYKPKSALAGNRVIKGTITDENRGVVLSKKLLKRMMDVELNDDVYNMVVGATIVKLEDNKVSTNIGVVEAIVDTDEPYAYATQPMIETLNLLAEKDIIIADVFTDKAQDDTIYAYEGVFAFDYMVEDGKIVLNRDGSEYLNVVYVDQKQYPNVTKYGYVNYATWKKYRIECIRNLFHYGNMNVVVFSDNATAVVKDMSERFPSGVMIQNINDSSSMKYRHYASAVNNAIIELVVVYVLLMVLTAILMYANFASSTKEVGIYRAIGVSKKNIMSKVFIECLSSTIMVAFIALLLVGIIVLALGTGAMFTLHLQWWLWLVLMVAVVAGMSLVSIIPVLTIIGKNPREILSKYDI